MELTYLSSFSTPLGTNCITGGQTDKTVHAYMHVLLLFLFVPQGQFTAMHHLPLGMFYLSYYLSYLLSIHLIVYFLCLKHHLFRVLLLLLLLLLLLITNNNNKCIIAVEALVVEFTRTPYVLASSFSSLVLVH